MANASESTVADSVTRLFHGLDARDWDTIRALAHDRVDIDYPSKQGGPEQGSAAAFVAGLQHFLPGFDATQHLLGPIVVDMAGENRATARFHARVTHVMSEVTEQPLWVIGCHYTIGMERDGEVWKLRSSRVDVYYQEGNRELEAMARRRARPDPPPATDRAS